MIDARVEEIDASKALVSHPRRLRHWQRQLSCKFSTSLVHILRNLRILQAAPHCDTVVLPLNLIHLLLLRLGLKALLRVPQLSSGRALVRLRPALALLETRLRTLFLHASRVLVQIALLLIP